MTALTQPHPDAARAGPYPLSGRARALIALAFFVAAFLHANLWGAIIPLWQIPDEAAHYEYVRLMVKLGRPPTPADADPELQAQMLRSMWENHYWEYLGFARPEQPPKRILPGGWISGGAIPDTAVIDDAFVYAFSNLSNSQPVYYALLAPVQVAVLQQPIDDQLRALRLFSRVIFALGILFIVLTAGELFKWNVLPVLGAGLFSVLQPMFVYIGSGVNNDNGVMLFASAAMWQLAAGWRRGYPWWRIGLIALLVALAVFAKRTGVFLVVWAPLVLVAWRLLRMERRRARRLVMAGAAATAAVGLLAVALYVIPGPTPANWRSAAPWAAGWQRDGTADGARAFRVQAAPGGTPWLRATFRRPLGAGDGHRLTLTAWHRGGPAALAFGDDVGNIVTTTLAASETWQIAEVSAPLDSRASRISVYLHALGSQPALFDALQAALATDPPQMLPLPNPSAEAALPVLGQLALAVAEPLGVYGQAVRLIQDYRANLAALGKRLPQAIAFVQQSYWGRFGIFARILTPTIDMGWVTLLAMGVGMALALVLRDIAKRRPDPNTAALMGVWLAGLGLLVGQTFAPLLSFGAEGTWLPQGRYLFAGMGMIAPIAIAGAAAAPPRKIAFGVIVLAIIMTLLLCSMLQQVEGFFTR